MSMKRSKEMVNNWFGYMRISTKEERGLQKFKRQEKKLTEWQMENNVSFVYVGKDDASGKNFEREDWKRIDKLARENDGIVFTDIARFTRGDVEEGYKKYMELFNRGIKLVFIDNPTVNSDYIKELLNIADKQNLLTKVFIESIIKILIIAELDKVEQERKHIIKKITDGIKASEKKSGRPVGKLDKMSNELEEDIKEYLTNRNITQADLMRKHNISANTLRKYIRIIKEKK